MAGKKHGAAAAVIAPTAGIDTEGYLTGIAFLDDDFEMLNQNLEDHIDTNFASQSFWKDAFARFVRNRGAVISFFIILFLIFMAIAGPYMTPYTYQQQIIKNQSMAPRIPGLEKLGIFDGSETVGNSVVNKYEANGLTDTYYWFGSDTLGRDIFARTWVGTRISLYIALVAVIVDMLFGLSYGLISGYFGGKVDMVMQRIAEIINGIPTLVIVTLLIIVMQPGLMTITFALMVSGWIGMSRIARAEMLKLKEQEFVLAARTMGAKDFRIIFKEVLPNIMGQLITQTMFSTPRAIFTEAFLAFIGLGVPAPMASLGSLISEAYKSLTTHPYMIAFPLVVLALLMLSFTIVADGLRDALDPKMKEM